MASEDAKVIGQFSSGTVFQNYGCETVSGTVWCAVRLLTGGPRGFAAAAFLEPAKGPDGIVPMGIDDSKKRARQRAFDETGEIPCAQEQGQALGTCKVAVVRSGGGDATIVVTFPNGFARDLYFTHGEFTRASATMSGVGTDMDWILRAELYTIRVDDQRFEIPADLILGN